MSKIHAANLPESLALSLHRKSRTQFVFQCDSGALGRALSAAAPSCAASSLSISLALVKSTVWPFMTAW